MDRRRSKPDDEDEFEDASETVTMDLETSVEDVNHAMNLFLNNRFEDSRKLLERWSETSMYHSLGVSVINFIEALLTFDQNYIFRASESLDKTVEMCAERRYKTKLKNMISKVNYNEYKPEQVHAELCYAEALLLRSMLYFIEDENFVSFIKAIMKVRNSFNSYQTCDEIRKCYKWNDQVIGKNFDSGVHMGVGLFNLMLSLLPKKILKLLEFIGFSARRDTGLRELNDGIKLEGTIRNVLCIMCMLNYHLMVAPAMTHLLGDNHLCDGLLKHGLKQYPDGMLFLLFKGRLEFMKGEFDQSQEWYLKAWRSQDLWPQFNHICFWELLWLSLVNQNYEEALNWTERLVDGSKWSRTIYHYLQGCLMMILRRPPKEVDEVMKQVPVFKKTMAGKSVPTEKFVIKRSQRYRFQNNWLCLPIVEMLHVYNMFKVMASNKMVMQNTLKIVDQAIDTLPKTGEYVNDNKCLGWFLKGCCLSRLELPLQAEECFKKVIKNEKGIKEDTHLPPFAYVEMAIMKANLKQFDEATTYLDIAKKKYSNFILESKLHVRMNSVQTYISDHK